MNPAISAFIIQSLSHFEVFNIAQRFLVWNEVISVELILLMPKLAVLLVLKAPFWKINFRRMDHTSKVNSALFATLMLSNISYSSRFRVWISDSYNLKIQDLFFPCSEEIITSDVYIFCQAFQSWSGIKLQTDVVLSCRRKVFLIIWTIMILVVYITDS